MIEWRHWLGLGALMSALAILLGAFGAHMLKGHLTEQQLQWYKTAFEYHIIHSLALLALGMFSSRIDNNWTQGAGWCFFLGMVLFSGSLYLMSLGLPKGLAMVTPLGGVSFISGWILLAVAAFKHPV
jgi:uncharacterized membrane protein YgdD (TMEM256/DUF423 family)